MAKEINVLVVEPGKAPRPAKVKNTLETFSEIVAGLWRPAAISLSVSCSCCGSPKAAAERREENQSSYRHPGEAGRRKGRGLREVGYNL